MLGVLDKARRRDLLDNHDYITARRRFLSETRRMAKLGILVLVPLSKNILVAAWKYIEKYHIYQADAVQLASAKRVACKEFATREKELHEVALSEGLKSTSLG